MPGGAGLVLPQYEAKNLPVAGSPVAAPRAPPSPVTVNSTVNGTTMAPTFFPCAMASFSLHGSGPPWKEEVPINTYPGWASCLASASGLLDLNSCGVAGATTSGPLSADAGL